MTDDLVAWLREQVDEDERVALYFGGARWRSAVDVGDEYNYGVVTDDQDNLVARCGIEVLDDGEEKSVHIARHDPSRVLAEVAAKRRTIDLHEGDHECSTYDRNGEINNCTWVLSGVDLCSTLRLLALPYAGHESYRAEWAPDEEKNRG